MGAETRFRQMFEEAYPIVVRYARHRGLSGADLEDCVSATFEVAWRRLDAVPEGESQLPWLLGVAQNHVRSHRRRLARDRDLLLRLSEPEPVPGPALSSLSWSEIREALGQLSAADRELLVLVAWDGLSPAQAAQVLGISTGAGRTRLHRARNRLAAVMCWSEHGEHSPGEPSATELSVRSEGEGHVQRAR